MCTHARHEFTQIYLVALQHHRVHSSSPLSISVPSPTITNLAPDATSIFTHLLNPPHGASLLLPGCLFTISLCQPQPRKGPPTPKILSHESSSLCPVTFPPCLKGKKEGSYRGKEGERQAIQPLSPSTFVPSANIPHLSLSLFF